MRARICFRQRVHPKQYFLNHYKAAHYEHKPAEDLFERRCGQLAAEYIAGKQPGKRYCCNAEQQWPVHIYVPCIYNEAYKCRKGDDGERGTYGLLHRQAL